MNTWPDTAPDTVPATIPATVPGGLADATATAIVLPRERLQQAVREGWLSPQQADAVWRLGETAPLPQPQPVAEAAPTPPAAAPQAARPAGPRFDFTHVLYYFGGMLAIGAMSTFLTWSWVAFGPWGGALLIGGYFIACLKTSDRLLARGLPVPAGILATLAVVLVPLLVWAVQMGLGWWPELDSRGERGARMADYHRYIDWRWVQIELASLAISVVMLWRMRLPFMVMPLAVTLWYLSMDLARMLMVRDGFDWTFMRDFSLFYGIAMVGLAVWVDVRSRRAQAADYAFWLYLFGAITAWSGLSLRDSGSEWGKLAYAVINAGLVFFGAAIGRRVFTVLGGLGVASYLGYLSWRLFKDSLVFPIALTLLGLGLVALGVWWQKNSQRIDAWAAPWRERLLPPELR